MSGPFADAGLAGGLAATHAAAFAPDRGWSPAEITGLLTQPGAVFCGDARAFIIGRVTLDEAEVITLAARPEFRRRGLARAALAAFETRALLLGARHAFLEVDAGNAAARALYDSAGWTSQGVRRGYYRHADGSRSDALVLGKTLKGAAA